MKCFLWRNNGIETALGLSKESRSMIRPTRSKAWHGLRRPAVRLLRTSPRAIIDGSLQRLGPFDTDFRAAIGLRERLRATRYTFRMAQRLFAATTNHGKMRDFRVAAAAHGIDIDSLPGLATIPAPEEDGANFQDNATLKAVYYSRFAPGQLVLADDSGLEVDALAGAPGVRSARFASDSGLVDSPDANDNTDVWNNLMLIQRLVGVPLAKRTARYRCVLVVALDGAALHTAEGTVEGLILEEPRGTSGFGYDPLFYLPQLERTMAEIDLETKLSLSHRGRAIEALLRMLAG
jgi:XTP/dITP diphosphohydrolase